MYFAQLHFARRFQEPIPLEDWARGVLYSTPIELSNIDRVPVTLVHTMDDESCPMEMAEWHLSEIRSPDKFIRFERGSHYKFGYASWDGLVERMVQTIETGTVLEPVLVASGKRSKLGAKK